MYSEQDIVEINGKIRKNWMVLAPVLLAIVAVYVYALSAGIEWLAMTAGPLLFVAACYGVLAYLWPNMRYRGFLQDMQAGLSRDMKGTILEISDAAELQDGAMVLPVRVRLDADDARMSAAPTGTVESKRLGLEAGEDTEGERIVYLNTSKRELLPGPGTRVVLHCYGRHIKSVER